MAIIQPDHQHTLAPTLGPLVRGGGNAKSALQSIRKAGAHAVQLDAAVPGLRPRELDHRGRRDLAASCARAGLAIAGVDLFVPRKHLTEPEHQDRAVTALSAAIELAADLGKRPVSFGLPVGDVPGDVIDALLTAADAHGVALAIHAEDRMDKLTGWLKQVDQPLIGAAIDPAAMLSLGHDPVAALHDLSKKLKAARLCDSQEQAGGERTRCPLGDGDLDLLAYRVALSMCEALAGPCVLDLRRLDSVKPALRSGVEAWNNTAPGI